MRAGVSLITAWGVELCRRVQCDRAWAQVSARRNLVREWLQIRWFVCRVRCRFAIVGKVRSSRVDTGFPRRIGWLCLSGRLYAEDPWFESSSSEEAEYAAEVVEEGFFVAGFNRVAKQVLLLVSRNAMNCRYPLTLSGFIGPTLS